MVYYRLENIFSRYLYRDNTEKAFCKFFAGSIAGMTAVLFTYPFDVMRTKLAYQTTHKLYNGIFHGFYTMIYKEGTSNMFKGISPTLIGMGIYGGSTFCIFFTLRNSFPDPGNMWIFLFGAFGGLIGQILSYPFDVVRKRMIAHGFIEKVSDYKSSFSGENLKGMNSFFRMIWNREGYRGILKGLSLNFVKAPIMLGTAHLSNHVIGEKIKNKE